MGAMHGRETVVKEYIPKFHKEPRAIAADISSGFSNVMTTVLCQQGHVDCCAACASAHKAELTEEYLKTQFGKVVRLRRPNQYNYKRYVGMNAMINGKVTQNHKIVPGDCGTKLTHALVIMRGAETAKGGEQVRIIQMIFHQTGMKYLVEKFNDTREGSFKTAFKEGADFTLIPTSLMEVVYSSPKARMRRRKLMLMYGILEKALDELDKEWLSGDQSVE
ncbi:hypothetical protein SPFM20_00244 [Salmonella phage SPFM20]|nr:hypothetical protein SPFM8_00244 [Salmonella phage SPFM8]VFR14922.1 hypothetical protein SPFM20_00244 [Salmonella phage SPFM20]